WYAPQRLLAREHGTVEGEERGPPHALVAERVGCLRLGEGVVGHAKGEVLEGAGRDRLDDEARVFVGFRDDLSRRVDHDARGVAREEGDRLVGRREPAEDGAFEERSRVAVLLEPLEDDALARLERLHAIGTGSDDR